MSVPEPPPRGEGNESERGLRGLVGAGSSQVSIAAAMRARNASQPSDDDLAAAERSLAIIRRGYVPTDTLPAGGEPAKRHPGSGGSSSVRS